MRVDDSPKIAVVGLQKRPLNRLAAQGRRTHLIELFTLLQELHRARQGVVQDGVFLFDAQGQRQVVGLGPERPQQGQVSDAAGRAQRADQDDRTHDARQMHAPVENPADDSREQNDRQHPTHATKGRHKSQTATQ